ncbi:MAG: bacteriocin [Draconibacterium sp.]|nr:bacteriocin [Draconibacterium sp.]
MKIKKLSKHELKKVSGGGLLAYRIGQAIRLAFNPPGTIGYAEWTADFAVNEVLMNS